MYTYTICGCTLYIIPSSDSLYIWTYRYILQYVITYFFLKQLRVFFIALVYLIIVYIKILKYDYKRNNLWNIYIWF